MGASDVALPASLPAASLQIHEELWHARKGIENVVRWAKYASAWLISLGALAVVYTFSPRVAIVHSIATVLGILDLVLGGLFFVGTAFGVLRDAYRSESRVEDWEDSMLPFLYKVKFELLPYDGPREADIWARFKAIYRDLSPADSDSWSDRLSRRMDYTELVFGREIRGKKEKHTFDIYATVGTTRALFVRRFKQEAPVSKSQLEIFKGEVEDRVRRAAEGSLVVAAFSAFGFSSDAEEYVRSEASWIRDDYPMDLIVEGPAGFRVAFVETN